MKEKALKACLKVIEKEGWKSFSFAKASEQSKIPLGVFHTQFSSPSDVMVQLFRKIDQAVLKNLTLSRENLSHKDALFEIIMARFDVAKKYKTIIRNFWHDCLFLPEETPALACQGFSSMAWMLEAAGLNPHGFKGILRIQGLFTLYLLTLRTWLEDDGPDLDKTMVFLDKGLSKLERASTFLNILS